ncbi:MAG: bifunctional folylpolyglutamate synthase/dihydrofolate synthase, partial [Oscillospiraceae bacterium]|nr:bifunctional folylpolyglutamate synthase/dihydrofolate synthase [Oscillospiraceae bacterium]
TGVLADKDYAEMYEPVYPYVKEFICVEPPNPRRLEAEKLAQFLSAKGVPATACPEIPDGVKAAIEVAGKDGTVLCFGSLYMIGDIRNALEAL